MYFFLHIVDSDSSWFFFCYTENFWVLYSTFVESIAYTYFVNAPDLNVVCVDNNEPVGVWLFRNTYGLRNRYKIMTWLAIKLSTYLTTQTSYDVYHGEYVEGEVFQCLIFQRVKVHLSVSWMYIHSWWLLHNSLYDLVPSLMKMFSAYTQEKLALAWASYQIRKIACCACAGNGGNVFPATDFKRNRYLAIPACITARASHRSRNACRDR